MQLPWMENFARMRILMMNFYTRLESHMKALPTPLDYKELHYLSRIASSQFHYWRKWDRTADTNDGRLPTDGELEKLASVKELGLPLITLQAWRALDQYGQEVIASAFEAYFPENTPRGQEVRQIIDELKRQNCG